MSSESSTHAEHDVSGGEDPAGYDAGGPERLQRIQGCRPGPAGCTAKSWARRDAPAQVAVAEAAVQAGRHHERQARDQAVRGAALQSPCARSNLRSTASAQSTAGDAPVLQGSSWEHRRRARHASCKPKSSEMRRQRGCW